ncbi:MAG: helix-turn-helix transcriptional regulator [Chitinophagales bacterium]|nr:helix-turn-helix transcriptional regulator [Chitinophagales bacterium]
MDFVLLRVQEAEPVARETQVLQMIADGYSSREIAGCLFISVSIVKSIRLDLLKKTGAPNAPSLVAYAYRKGMIK